MIFDRGLVGFLIACIHVHTRTHTHTHTHTCIYMHIYAYIYIYIYIYAYLQRQIARQVDRYISRQIDRQIRLDQIDRQTDKILHKQTISLNLIIFIISLYELKSEYFLCCQGCQGIFSTSYLKALNAIKSKSLMIGFQNGLI